MEKKVFKFPEIEALRNVIKSVEYRTWCVGKDDNGEPIFDETIPLPKLKYRGSVKLHGTNAGVIFQYNHEEGHYEMYCQSRTNIITPQKDNNGFAAFAYTVEMERLLGVLPPVNLYSDEEYPTIKIYGEWCGSNIQKGVALNQLDKMFVIFGVKIDNAWLPDIYLKEFKMPEAKIYNILDYITYEIEIDFNNPKLAADKIGKLVDNVEKECPVGKAFGVSGIGEGIVFTCQTEGWGNSRFWFKAKGEKHSDTKRDKKNKVPVDTEKINKINELVEFLITEHRLLKGIDYLNENHLEITRKSTGPFVKWVYDDVIKEELDTIMGNGFEPKEVSKYISTHARNWFFKYVDELVGL